MLPLLAAGCASLTTPPAAAPAPPALPAAWSQPATATASAASADWWPGFGDPLLVQFVDAALAANTDVTIARAALAQARAQRDVTAAGQALQVGSSASVGRNRSNESNSNSLRAGLDASWEADLFGAQASATRAAQAQADASAATLQATRLAVAGNTAIAYLQWQGTRAQLGVARDSVASQEKTLQLAQWRVQAGLVSSLDVEQARSSLEQTRAQLPALQATLAQTENQLAVLLGQAPGTLAAQLATAPAATTAPALPALGVPADVLRRRPDVLAAELKVAAQLASLSQREAERLPSFGISGNLALQAATWSALGGPAAVVAGLAASVNWPLLDGGAGRAQVAAQQAVLDGARASYQAAVLTALQDVEDQLVALSTGTEKVATLQRADSAARLALQLARQRYQAGLIDFGTLLDSERSVLSSADALSSARSALAVAHVRLYKGLGGGWSAADVSAAATTTRP